MLNKSYKLTDIHNYLKSKKFEKKFELEMSFRKFLEYIYKKKLNLEN